MLRIHAALLLVSVRKRDRAEERVAPYSPYRGVQHGSRGQTKGAGEDLVRAAENDHPQRSAQPQTALTGHAEGVQTEGWIHCGRSGFSFSYFNHHHNHSFIYFLPFSTVKVNSSFYCYFISIIFLYLNILK